MDMLKQHLRFMSKTIVRFLSLDLEPSSPCYICSIQLKNNNKSRFIVQGTASF